MESAALVAPVTALEFAGDVLLAGTGPEVVAFQLSGGGPAAAAGRRSVLCEATVQGLRAESGGGAAVRVAAFGSRCLAVLTVRRVGPGGGARLAACGGGAARELGARVWEARWAAGGRLALALGGGTVGLYEWRSGGSWLQRTSCSGAGALRCAVLAGTGWTRLALAAGTATGVVVVWRAAEAAAPRRRLRGHRGAVLALCYAAPRGLLVSASEDRSVRLWAVGELGGGDGDGDGDKESSCLLVCYGHGARVAAVALRGPLPVSVGEDGACLEWDGCGGVGRARRGHRGALRALALRPAGGCLATGGDDGGVRLWRPQQATPVAAALGAPGRPRAVLLAGPRRVLVLDEAGGLAVYEGATGRWVPVLPLAAGGSRGVLVAIPLPGADEALCALGCGDGRLLLFALGRPGDTSALRLFEGGVRGLGWAPRPGQPPDATALMVSGPDGEMLWLDVVHRPGQAPGLRLMGRYLLPRCKQRWHTCATFLPQGGLLVCGDRRGSLLLFPCSSSLGRAVESTSIANGDIEPGHEGSDSKWEPSCLLHRRHLPLEAPLSVLFGLHGKTGVTSVTCHGGYIYSTGRDGVYRQLHLQAQQLEVLRKHRPCKGLQWIEELRFTMDGDLLVLGFHADNFVVWSSRTGENLHCVPCGGGHRSWSYWSNSSAEAFAFIKCGDVMLYHCEAKPREQQVLLASLHGREITCVRRLGTVEVPGHSPVNVFITGSEDTTACILALSEPSRTAVPLIRLSDHISSVRALALASPAGPGDEGFSDKGLSALLFSAGGRAQIECYRLLCAGDPASKSAVTCHVVHLASHRLDEHWERKKNRHKLVKMDPETRYMSLSVVPGTSTKQLPTSWKFLAAACSDGSVRVFGLLEAARKLLLVAESFYHQRCVLKVEAFLYTGAGGERRYLLCSAATDGSIAFWDITGPIADAADALHQAEGEMQPLALGSPLLTVVAHSCGVNSLHIHERPEGRYLVASGSDDGSIHICLLEVTLGEATAETHLRILERVARPCAHAAHVTGIRLLRHNLLLSASVDQRLTLWHWALGKLDALSTTFFHVPDLAELDCWEVAEASGELRYYCVLCGQGLEMLHGVAPPTPQSEAPQ